MKVVVTFVPKEEEVEMKKMVLELDLSMPASKVRNQFLSFRNFSCRWRSPWAVNQFLSLRFL